MDLKSPADMECMEPQELLVLSEHHLVVEALAILEILVDLETMDKLITLRLGLECLDLLVLVLRLQIKLFSYSH